MSGARQLTIDGAEVRHPPPGHADGDSRMVRHPPSGFLTSTEFLSSLRRALKAASVEPGDAFYVSRVPPRRRVFEPTPGGARRSDPSTSKRAALDAAPRTGSQRHALLVQYEIAGNGSRFAFGGLTAEMACGLIDKPGAWRRVSELLDGGFIEPTGKVETNRSGSEAEVYRITEKGRAALR